MRISDACAKFFIESVFWLQGSFALLSLKVAMGLIKLSKPKDKKRIRKQKKAAVAGQHKRFRVVKPHYHPVLAEMYLDCLLG